MTFTPWWTNGCGRRWKCTLLSLPQFIYSFRWRESWLFFFLLIFLSRVELLLTFSSVTLEVRSVCSVWVHQTQKTLIMCEMRICEWILSTETEFFILFFLRALVIPRLCSGSQLPPATFSRSSLLRTPGILLPDISSLSPFPLSLKLLFYRLHTHTHCFSDTCLLTNSVVCELFTCVWCVCACAAEIFPSCTSGVINIGDPNTVIGCGPGREGWGAKEGQWRKMEVEGGGGRGRRACAPLLPLICSWRTSWAWETRKEKVAKITERSCWDLTLPLSLYTHIYSTIILLSSLWKSITAASQPSGEDRQRGEMSGEEEEREERWS